MLRIKESLPISNLFKEWVWDDNFKHWYCLLDEHHKAIVWLDWLNPPDEKNGKLSKSTDERKLLWDGICTGIIGGPEPTTRPGPILKWIKDKYDLIHS